MYRLTEDPNLIQRIDDGTLIPRGHRWWQDYAAWCQAGHTPQPMLAATPDPAELPPAP